MSGQRLALSRHAVSPKRQNGSPLRMFGLDAGPSGLVPPQPPGWAHLVSLRSGAAVLSCGDVRSVLTPETAVWIPPQREYALDLRTRCRLRIVYAAADRYPPPVFGAVRMTALAHELFERMTARGYLDPSDARDARLLAVIADELGALPAQRMAPILRFPRDAAMRTALEHAAARADDRIPLRTLAEIAGMSLRTFERRFAADTGLSPRAWLRQARLQAAMIDIAAGKSVTEAALESGYASLSAFIAAYRNAFGTTPGRRRTFESTLRSAS